MMDASLLDTDILTEIFKGRNQYVATNATNYLHTHGQFAFSAMTRFEVVRGLRHKRANTMLASFSSMCARMAVFPISDDVLDRAADLWVTAEGGSSSTRRGLNHCCNCAGSRPHARYRKHGPFSVD
jgi:predicted nucleic acid-binding protein